MCVYAIITLQLVLTRNKNKTHKKSKQTTTVHISNCIKKKRDMHKKKYRSRESAVFTSVYYYCLIRYFVKKRINTGIDNTQCVKLALQVNKPIKPLKSYQSIVFFNVLIRKIIQKNRNCLPKLILNCKKRNEFY